MTSSVEIRVMADRPIGKWRPVWNWFGYDEPNYTYLPNGKKLLRDLAALHDGPVYARAHNLLTSGDGAPSLKWGSTGVYREDATGASAYSWAIMDRIFDAYVEAGVTPFVQAGFMPEALTTGPAPYRHGFPDSGITTGWAWPPKDYGRWSDLIEAWARHLVERYGAARVAHWPWEIWNEPDGLYWKGTIPEFCHLHDIADAAIRRAIPEARVGGPHTCGPLDAKAAAFLRAFLEHAARGRNYATGKTGTQLDFIAFHAKGKPRIVEGHVRMGIATQLGNVAEGLKIVLEFPEFAGVPVVLGESDPEGCAACSIKTHPENIYREGPIYGASVVEATTRTLQLAARNGIAIEGAVNWAFEFEGEPFFAGYRELATNGIAKPVLNAFRMLGMLKGERLMATSSAALSLNAILDRGVAGAPDIDCIATRDDNGIHVLVWNYHDDDLPEMGEVPVALEIGGLRSGACIARHYRMDGEHSNAHAAFRAMGAPRRPTRAQYSELEAASRLACLREPTPLVSDGGTLRFDFSLPRHAVSLISLSSA